MTAEIRDEIAESQEKLRNFILGLLVATIKMPSQRDLQKAPGPSDLGNDCDLCVAKSIARCLGLDTHLDDNFSLKAWLGTAVHEKLQRDMPRIYRHASLEIEVDIAEIPGIGPVVGHVDAFLPDKRAAVDWKTTDKKKLEGYKKNAGPAAFTQGLSHAERQELDHLKAMDRNLALDHSGVARMVELMSRSEEHSGGVPLRYKGQTMLYLYGLRAAGLPADYAVLGFIPRDSNYVEDIWVTSCAYDANVAVGVLKRAEELARLVREGRLASIAPNPECWPCVKRPRLSRRGVVN